MLTETAKELEKRWHIEGDMLVREARLAEEIKSGDDIPIGGRIDDDLMYTWILMWERDYGRSSKNSDDWEEAKEMAGLVKQRVCRYMNNWHVIITKSSGKPICIEEIRNENSRAVQFVSRDPTSLRAAYMKYTCKHKLMGSPAEMWLTSPLARSYDSVVFTPNLTHTEREFNLFRGLAITREDSVSGDTTLFEGHIHNFWCKGEKKMSDYVLNWMAHIIQRPGEKIRTVPVLKGGQGAGKGVPITEFLAKIVGEQGFIHCMQVEQALSDSFSMEKSKTNLVTFLDEATFSGDKKQASQLKGLISESTRYSNTKYVNPVELQNHSNYIIATNYSSGVRTELDDRRFMNIEVDNRYSGPQTPESEAYFNALRAVDVLAVAHMLYNRDLSTFNPRAVPSSAYQRHQKVLNFESSMAFIEGVLRDASDFTPVIAGIRVLTQTKEDFYAKYREFCAQGSMRIAHRAQLFKDVKESVGETYTLTRESTGMRRYQISITDLALARDEFCKRMREAEWEWD